MPLGMIGKYERLDVLGHGVSGIVYLAKDTLLNKQVALKEVDVQAGDLRRFLEEARVMDRLRHANIVRVNNVDRIDGKVIIDMEYVRGLNLQEMLRQEGTLPIERALDIAAQVLDALDYAHQMQTVHRDIKPANILIGRDGQVKLVDFGLAEILATNAYAGGAGTYAYMAPEDFAEDDRSDHQSDIWAVGVTLYEAVTGQRPFNVVRVKDPFSWKRALETEAPTPLAEYLPADTPRLLELQTVLDRALARDKQQRYPTAGEFRDDLLRLKAGQSVAVQTQRVRRGLHLRRTPAVSTGSASVPTPLDTASASVSASIPASVPASIPTMDILDTPVVGSRKTGAWWEEESVSPSTHSLTNSSTSPSAGSPSTPNSPLPPDSQQPTASNSRSLGRVVADVNAAPPADAMQPVTPQPKGRVAKLPLSRRNAVVRLLVEPGRVDFGAVRKGELPSVKIMARVSGADGDVEGRVVHSSQWLTAHPPAFERARQAITLTAHTERAWETGEFYETVRVETNAGVSEIPVRLVVLPPRASFWQIVTWYAPLFTIALLPALAVALGSGSLHHQATTILGYTPSAAIVSGLLALMLLLIGIAAEIGIAERIACGVLIAIMCAVTGVSLSQIAHTAHDTGNALVADRAMQRAFMASGFMGGVVLLQLLHLRKWKLWAFVMALLGLLIGGALLKILAL